MAAERIEDLSAWLALLSAQGPAVDGLARADEVRRGTPGVPAPRKRAEREAQAAAARKVMPKGRNFH